MTLAELETCQLLMDKKGRTWINEEQIAKAGYRDFQNIEIIRVGEDDFYDVMGYSSKRRAFWCEAVEFDFDNLEGEVEAYVESLREGEVPPDEEAS